MEEQVYAITDVNSYSLDIREAAAKSISDNYHQDNLDNYISIDQMVGLIKTNSVGVDDENRPLLTETANEKIFEDTAIWIHNVALAKLAGADMLECAWDDQNNTMIFWYKEQQKTNESKPKRKRKRKDS